MSITLTNIRKTFGDFQALKGIDLHIQTGELLALLGPSGSGKTTLLRIIAGLEAPDADSGRAGAGAVRFHDQDVSGRHVAARGVGFVFQHYALFRHMTVADNVAFGLDVRPRRTRPKRREIRRRVDELLHLVQLDRFADRFPQQLSGGQRQRVALARALAVEPRVLLLDEPFGALDAKVRRELRKWLRELHTSTGITTVFVTHDQEEALEVSDRVAILNQGKIEQVATPDVVYDRPASPFVYNFLGNVNLFHGRATGRAMQVGQHQIRTADTLDGDEARDAVAYVRPHEIELTRDAPAAGAVGASAVRVNAVGIGIAADTAAREGLITDGSTAHGATPDGSTADSAKSASASSAGASSADAIAVRVAHVSSAGPVVRVHATRLDTADPIEIELPRDRFKELAPIAGETLFARLREVRVFTEDYSI